MHWLRANQSMSLCFDLSNLFFIDIFWLKRIKIWLELKKRDVVVNVAVVVVVVDDVVNYTVISNYAVVANDTVVLVDAVVEASELPRGWFSRIAPTLRHD